MRKHYRWWATAAALVIGLIFVSVQQTSARWTAAETLSGGTIQSGILDLTVGSAGSGQSSYDFTALGATGMFPNAYAQAPLTVHNSGSVPLIYRIQNVTQSSADVPLSLAVTPVTSEAGCPAQGAASGTAIYDGPMVGAQVPTAPGWRPVAAGGTDILCLRGTVGPDVASGVSTSVHFSFEAESV